MSIAYNSQKIRTVASQIGRAADGVSDVNTYNMNSIQNEVPANFKGSTATALQDSVSDLMADLRTVSEMLYDIKSSLNTLATRVEQADQQAKSIIKAR